MLTSVILEQNVLQKWNILFCGLYVQPDQPQDLLPDGGRGGVRGSHEPGNDGGRVRWK